jgi:hypothetical protein
MYRNLSSLAFQRYTTDRAADTTGALFLGVELEVVGPNLPDAFSRVAWPQRAGVDLFGIKSDCSLSYQGELGPAQVRSDHTTAELWTQPFSAAYYRRTLRRRLTAMLESFAQHGVTSNRTCGMHIHVSQTAFDDDAHFHRFARLFYRYPNHTLWLSGRRSLSAMNHWASCPRAVTTQQVAERSAMGHRSACAKTHKRTTEVRVFAGTVDPTQFHKNIESILAGVAFSRVQTTWDRVTTQAWRHWVMARATRYPALAPFFASYVPRPVPTPAVP